ncbi:MAG: hypothetical protein AAF697_04340 [Pseudomonadota bacterium]
MTTRNINLVKALGWAALILALAFIMQTQDMSQSASFGVIAGLAGASWGSLNIDNPCGKGCLE